MGPGPHDQEIMTTKPADTRAVHGTYIRDDRRWRFVREISVDAAVRLLGIPEAERQRMVCPNRHGWSWWPHRGCTRCNGTGYLPEHLWLNKGFIVVGHAIEPGKDKFAYTFPAGTQAVALHDDRYGLYVFGAAP